MATKTPTNLTQIALERMRPEAEPYRVPDARCKGLAARIATDGRISWDLAFRIKGGRFVRTSLSHFPAVTIEHARRRANALTEAARAGRDLLREEQETKAEEAREVTVSDLVVRYVRVKRKAGLRSVDEMDRRLKRALAPLLLWKAKDVRRRDIRELLDKVADSDRDREAEKRRQIIGAMFRWALARDEIDADPTHGLPSYGNGAPRERTLDEEEIRTLLAWLPVIGLPEDHVTVLRLQLLLGARCGEVAGMQRSEIDVDRWLWTLPVARSKNKRARVTPLVGAARELVLTALDSGRVGPLFRAESGIALAATHVGQAIIHRRDKCPIPHWCTHDLRRTFVSRMVDMGISIDLIAAIIGHESGGRETRTLMRHYVRTDQVERKRAALEAWDRRIADVRGLEPEPNIRDFGRAAKIAR